MDGQKEADKSKMRLKNEEPLPFRVYTLKIEKPSRKVYKVLFDGIQSWLAFTYTKATDKLINNIIPTNILTGAGILVPKSIIKNLSRGDRTVRRETKDAIEPDYEYEKMRAQEKKKNKLLKKLQNWEYWVLSQIY